MPIDTPPAPEPTEANFFTSLWGYSSLPNITAGAFHHDVGNLRDYVAAQLRAANQPKDDDAQAINFYLGCIAQHGEPAMDMGHWSDFVNRVQRVARASAQLAAKEAEIARLREALRFYAGKPRADNNGYDFEKELLRGEVARAALKPQQQETSK